MPTGGHRPGAGRKSAYFYIIGENKYNSLSEAAKSEGVSTKTIHNWCRPENKKKADCRMEPKTDDQKRGDIPEDIRKEAEKADMTPLDYMLSVMRDKNADQKRRDTMAYWAAPYIHSKADSKKGKKEEKDEKAKKAGSGRFKRMETPLKRVK